MICPSLLHEGTETHITGVVKTHVGMSFMSGGLMQRVSGNYLKKESLS